MVDVDLGEYPFALVASPFGEGTAYVAGGGGMRRSEDEGRTWSIVDYFTSTTGISVSVDPVDPRRVFASTAFSLHRSDDGGRTWQETGGLFPANDFVFDPLDHDLVYAASGHRGGGLYKTTDGGASWTRLAPDVLDNVTCLERDAGDPRTLYASFVRGRGFSVRDGLARSDDGGSSWVPANQGLLNLGVTGMCIDPVDPQVLYAAVLLAGVYKSRDGGRSWAAASTGLATQNIFSLAIDPAAPQTVYAGGQRGALYRSVDGGASWDGMSPDLNISGIRGLAVGSGDPATLYLATLEDGVLTSTDNGTSWSTFNDGLTLQDIR